MAVSVQQLIDGLYIAFYNRSADQPGYLFWENQVGLTQAQATNTFVVDRNYQYAQPLGTQFFNTQSTYFNSTYSGLTNTAFVNQIYVNFGGNQADANGLAYWTNFLNTQSRQQVAYEIAQDFLTINLATANLSATDLAQATIRQQTFNNKVIVSEFYAAASATHPFLVAQTASTSDQAFNAEIAIVQGITQDPATVTAAENKITAAVAAGNVTPITSTTTTPPVTTPPVTLTLGTDMVTGSANGTVINAPILFNAGTGTQITTLQPGDTISETGTGNSLNLNIGVNDKTIAGVPISGVQTFNISNLGFVGGPVIQGAGIAGLSIVNNVNSTNAVQVGSAASALATAVATVGVSSTTGSPNLTKTTVFVATSALAGTADALTVTANAAGSMTNTDLVLVGAATGTNGYETITVNATGTDFVGIGNPIAGANTTTSVIVTGAGTLSLFGDGAGNDFTKLATIDASAATGPVTITGASTPGAGIGLLTGDTAIQSVKGGAGADLVDISSLTLAQFTANTTTVDLGAGRNTLVVDNSIAATTTALTGLTNVQILGDANAGGAIDFSKLPTSIDTFKLFGNETANITLTNTPSTFTFDQGTFKLAANGHTSITAVGTGTTDVLNIIEGSATAGNISNEFFTTVGYETINVTAQGGPDQIFQIKATASAGGAETLNIGGTTALTILSPIGDSAVVLSGNNTTIHITDTAAVTLATTGNTGSTNAQTIDASMSGGLIMGGVATGNNGVAGQSITGSTASGNILIGSPGNDAINSGALGDVVATDGGADTVTLGATHLASHVEIYGVDSNATVQTLGWAQGALTNSIVNTNDQAAGGFWGVAPGTTPGAATNVFTLFPGTTATNFGTSADQVIVKNFVAGTTGDSIDISLKAFSPQTGLHDGLIAVDLTHPAGLGNAVITPGISGGTLAGATSDLVVLSGANSTFANANALASALKSGTFALTFSAPTVANFRDHILFAYSDGANTHIADVAIQEAGGSAAISAQTHVAASDLVQLTGVATSALTNNNVHIVA